jgi:hypothetical protein
MGWAMIDNQVVKDFFESLQNTERDFLTIESFEHHMKLRYQPDNKNTYQANNGPQKRTDQEIRQNQMQYAQQSSYSTYLTET